MPIPPDLFAGAKILLVEDDPQAIGLLERILVSKGFSVTIARDGVDGLDKIRSTSPDIVLLDIHMPRLDGISVCKAVKNDASTRLIPVVMVTALSDLESKLSAMEAGADEFVNKPYNHVELFTRLRSLLRVKQLNEQLDCAEDVLFSMARAIEAKDAYTQGHVERVSNFAVQLGRYLGFPEEDIDSLRKGGVLHDIGKIGVPDQILNKAGLLTMEERSIVQLHPVHGSKICEKLKSIRGAIPIIRHHHERLDGTGYPDQLTGEEIPVLARVMTIVDIYDALTTTRSYRKELPATVALQMMWEEANRGWWDKEILREFVQMLSEQATRVVENVPASAYGSPN